MVTRKLVIQLENQEISINATDLIYYSVVIFGFTRPLYTPTMKYETKELLDAIIEFEPSNITLRTEIWIICYIGEFLAPAPALQPVVFVFLSSLHPAHKILYYPLRILLEIILVFKSALTGVYDELRFQLEFMRDSVKVILANPNEIWLNLADDFMILRVFPLSFHQRIPALLILQFMSVLGEVSREIVRQFGYCIPRGLWLLLLNMRGIAEEMATEVVLRPPHEIFYESWMAEIPLFLSSWFRFVKFYFKIFMRRLYASWKLMKDLMKDFWKKKK